METSPMETDGAVFETPAEPENKSDEIAPVEICETLLQSPEIEKLSVQQVNMLDVTKLSYEVQQGYRVFVEMSADSYKNVTWPFMEPVDAESLGLWDYHEKIKKPMSFYEIGSKFNNYEYNSITEVIADIRLILENCYRYNGSNHWVSKLGHKMEKILEQKLALLNRSLRDKVSLEATMALKSDSISVATPEEGTGRRRTAPRNSYVKMINGEDSSSLLTRLKIQEDIEERERRRNREKEKKEANLVLLQDLAEWEEKELGADVMKELHSMWEIPSLAGLLFLLKDFLYIQDLSITELELGFVYANKSSLLARIFTALLLTPHQRKSLFKKPPMKFKVWESKLCDRINSWYKATEKDGQELTCHQYGLDMALFEVLGEVNPLLEKSYMDLTLHRRVWILKSLCDNSLVRDYDFRDHLATIAPIDQRELFLGNDADNWSYLYFPIFSAADLRIYKQCPLDVPTLSKRKKKVTPPPPPPPVVVKAKVTPARAATPTQSRRNTRLRKLRNSTPSPEPESPTPPSPPPPEEEEPLEPKNTIAEGFELSAYDIETLKKLCEKFDEPPPPPKKRGRKPKPPTPRKRCEVELHQTLLALLEELEKYEMSFSKLLSKAKIKIMKESQEPEPEDEPEEVIPAEEGEEWGSEESIGDEIEDAGARNMSSDEDYILEDEECRKSKTLTANEDANKAGEKSENKGNPGTQIVLPQKRKAENANIIVEGKQPSASARIDTDNDACSISIQTAPLKLKKKRKMSTPAVSQMTSLSVPQVTSPGIVQANQKPVSHVPAGLQVVKEIRAANVAAVTTTASVNKNVVSAGGKNVVSAGGINSLATSRIFVVGTPPSTSITQADKNASSVRIHPKPVILNKSHLSTVSKPNSSAAVPSAHVQTSSTASVVASSLLSQAGLSTAVPGLGKVLFVTSSGVPLQVLKTVPVSQQPLVQGKTLNTAALGTSSKSFPVCVVSSSQSLSTPTEVSVLANSSFPAKSSSGASHLSSSPIQKVVISTVPTKLANILSTVKKTSHVSTTSASPLNPSVILVQRPGAGGIVPLAIKGGAVVMSSPSASQQLVVIRPSSTLTSSTTSSATTLTSGTGISVLGNAQTALGHKVVLAPTILSAGQSLSQLDVKSTSVSTGNKSVVQLAMSPKGMKPSEPKTTSVSLGSKPVVTTTTAMPASSKVLTSTTSTSTAATTTTSVVTGNGSSVHVAMSPKSTTLESKPIVTTTTTMVALSKVPTTTVTVDSNSTATTTTSFVTGNRSSVHVAMSPKTTTLGSKPIVTTTTDMVASSKEPTTNVTVDSNSTATTPTSVVTGNRSSVHVASSPKTTTLRSKPIVIATTAIPASSKEPITTVTVDINSTATTTSVVTGNRSSVPVATSPKLTTLGSKPIVTTTLAMTASNKEPIATVTVGSNSTAATTSVVSGNKPFVQVAVSPIGMKPYELKTAESATLGSKPVVTTTTTTSSCTLSKTLITTILITSSAESESICTASPAQVDMGTTSAQVTAPNEYSTKMESQHVCSTGVPVYDTVTRTVSSHCDAVKMTDTRTVSVLSPDSDLKLNNSKFKDNLSSSKTITLDNSIANNDSVGQNEKDKDIKNASELLLDLTCYETNISDSAGCEESDDSTSNGLHPDTKTKLPSELTETHIKVCNGNDSPLTRDTKCDENELDSGKQNHAAVLD